MKHSPDQFTFDFGLSVPVPATAPERPHPAPRIFDREHPQGAPEKPTLAFIRREANGVEIDQRREDGYFNATAMCRAYGKRFNDYRVLDQTAELLKVVSADTGIPVTDLVQSRRGGNERGGTWVQPLVAYHLAQWLSPEFAVIVSHWIDDIRHGRIVSVDRAREADPFVLGKLLAPIQAMAQNALTKAETAQQQVTDAQLELWRFKLEIDGRVRRDVEMKRDNTSPPVSDWGDWRTWRPRRADRR